MKSGPSGLQQLPYAVRARGQRIAVWDFKAGKSAGFGQFDHRDSSILAKSPTGSNGRSIRARPDDLGFEDLEVRYGGGEDVEGSFPSIGDRRENQLRRRHDLPHAGGDRRGRGT